MMHVTAWQVLLAVGIGVSVAPVTFLVWWGFRGAQQMHRYFEGVDDALSAFPSDDED